MTGLQPGAATMTVLFTDLVDSTAMRSRLGDDQADEVRREHDDLINRIVDENRGSIVKGLGDGVMAVFGAPSAGLAAAVGIQQAVARRNRAARVPIALKLGLSVGEVRVESDDVYGTPVVEASRLCGAAGADQILAAEHVKLLAGSRSTATYREHGELELKGLADPLRTLEVLWWEASDAPTVPFPDIPTLVTPYDFVGRSIERYALGHAWLNARTARAPVVLLTGPAGVGKTRLVVEWAQTAQNEGGLVLYGRCNPLSGPAFQPFAEAVRYYVSNVPSGQLADLLGPFATDLARLVPDLGEQLFGVKSRPVDDPDLATLRLFDAVAGLLAAASRDDPVLLILDDLQWASGATLQMLQHIAESPTPMRVLIVGAYDERMPAQGPSMRGLVDRLRRSERGIEPIELRGLAAGDVEALLTAAVGDLGDRAGSLAARLHVSVQGNPFRTIEVVRHLRASGIDLPAAPIESLTWPESTSELVAARLAALDPAVRDILQLASVIGVEFEVSVLRALTDLDDGALDAALAQAEEAQLISALAGARIRYAFAHGLVQEAVASTVDAARSAELHGRIADEIERQAGPADEPYVVEIAQHRIGAVAQGGPVADAVEYAVRAGDRARDQLAHDEAAAWYRRAVRVVESSDDDSRLLDLLLALGAVERRAGQAEAAATLLRAASVARARHDDAKLVAAATANTRTFTGHAAPLDPERVSVLRDALAAVGPGPSAERALVLSMLASELVWAQGSDERFSLADEALDLARAVGDKRVLATVLRDRLVTIATPDTLEERISQSDDLYGLAGELDDPLLRFHAAHQRAWAAGEAGDIDGFDHWLGIAATVASGLDLALLSWLVSVDRSSRALLAGDLAAAERHAEEARRAGEEAGRADAEAAHRVLLFAIRLRQGNADEVAAELDGSGSSEVADGFAVARALADAGRLDEVADLFRAAADGGFALRRGPTLGASLSNLAELAALFGDEGAAAVLYQELEPWAERFAPAVAFPHAGAHELAMLAATLGRNEDAERWFGRAVELHDGVHAPIYAAETRLEWARLCLGTGDVERARELIGQALTASVKGNAPGIEARARGLLTASFGGEEPRHTGDVAPEAVAAATPPAPVPPAPVAPQPVAPQPVPPAPVAPARPAIPPVPPVPPPPGPIPVRAPAPPVPPPPPSPGDAHAGGPALPPPDMADAFKPPPTADDET